ncbi:hypothetical protein [Neobacillus mesonae]|nr:hypothetical protein [Neobacillus mesonae]
MELLFEQCEHNDQDKPCEVCAPKTVEEENVDPYEYDYNKRLWF